MTVEVAEVTVADPTDAWTAAGFEVDADGVSRIGDVRIRLVGRTSGKGIAGWSLRGIPDGALADLDGIPTTGSTSAAEVPATHPNGVTAIDHVVVLTPDLRRTVAALTALGVNPRRERDGDLGGRSIRQVFFRFGAVIVEVVGPPDAKSPGPADLWGITYVVTDVDATAAFLDDRTTPVKDAVQPGRRITTLRHREFGMSVRTAFISTPILGA